MCIGCDRSERTFVQESRRCIPYPGCTKAQKRTLCAVVPLCLPLINTNHLCILTVYDIRVSDSGLQIDAIKDFDVHAIRRKPWTRALAPGALKDYEEIVMSKTGLLMEKLTERVGQDVDISAWMSYYGCVFALGSLLSCGCVSHC